MRIIEVDTIGDGWIEVCKAILNDGKDIMDDDQSLKEITHLFLKIKKPEEEDEIIKKFGDKKMLEWMMSNFFEQKIVPELKNSLSYGTRLFNYKGKDQIKWVVEKLKKKPESKSATISMLMANEDKGYIPCVSLLDFKIRNGKLVLTTLCRSLDFGGKAYANLVALEKIQDMVAKGIGVLKGEMILHVVSAHIYEKDLDKIRLMLSTKNRKVVKK